MSLFIESIRLHDGKFSNLFYHEQRMIRSLEKKCGIHEQIDLETFLHNLNIPKVGLYKCRIVYDDKSRSVEFIPYQPRTVQTLKIVQGNNIDYEYKYSDRTAIDKLFNLRETCDDIIIVKKGKITDTSYANLAFKKDGNWYTPWSALLKGTMRQYLIDNHLLHEEDIEVDDLTSFESCKLINAMVGFEGTEVSISNILP